MSAELSTSQKASRHELPSPQGRHSGTPEDLASMSHGSVEGQKQTIKMVDQHEATGEVSHGQSTEKGVTFVLERASDAGSGYRGLLMPSNIKTQGFGHVLPASASKGGSGSLTGLAFMMMVCCLSSQVQVATGTAGPVPSGGFQQPSATGRHLLSTTEAE